MFDVVDECPSNDVCSAGVAAHSLLSVSERAKMRSLGFPVFLRAGGGQLMNLPSHSVALTWDGHIEYYSLFLGVLPRITLETRGVARETEVLR